MSTDDCTTVESKCLCGNGTISVERCTPDHPWARASQTSYSAALQCVDCAKKYAIGQHSYNVIGVRAKIKTDSPSEGPPRPALSPDGERGSSVVASPTNFHIGNFRIGAKTPDPYLLR